MLRKGMEQDCQAIYHLMCNLENKTLPYVEFEKIYMKQVKNKNIFALVYVSGDNVLGFLNLRFEEQLHHCETIAEILEFVVDDSCRNQGIGKEMFQEACRIAIEHGCSQIEVASNQLRSGSHRFYEREGMHRFHYKFSKRLIGEPVESNTIGV